MKMGKGGKKMEIVWIGAMRNWWTVYNKVREYRRPETVLDYTMHNVVFAVKDILRMVDNVSREVV